MNRPVNAWSCEKCGTAGYAEQNFCRRCGAPRPARRPAPITEQVPITRRATKDPSAATAISRIRLALVALLFIVVGGLGAIIVNDLRGAEPANPAEQPISTTSPDTDGSVVSSPTSAAGG